MTPVSEPLFLGVDVGTGGVRVLAVDPAGRVVAQATAEHPLHVPRPGWTEQDPRDWWQAAVRCFRQVTGQVSPGQIQAIGLTGQMHGSVFLDRHGEVIRPALLWNDQRTVAECREIEDRVGTETLLRIAGNPALTGFTAPKVLWLRRHEPEHYARLAHLLLPKDYLRYRLTGALATDVADASGTLLLDVGARRWSQEIIAALELNPAILPKVYEGPEITGRVTPEAAAETGLPPGIPVVAGGGDQAAGAVGVGLVRPGQVSMSVGTSGVVFAPTERPGHLQAGAAQVPPGLDPRSLRTVHSFCHAVPGLWHVMGVMLSSGGSLRWFRDTFYRREAEEDRAAGQEPYDRITREAAEVPPGAEGLLFLPYLTGERTPHANPYARGVFVGLGLHHDRRHLARAVLEGIALGLRDSLDLIRALGVSPTEIRITGGGARSPIWRSIMAAVMGIPLRLMAVDEGPAFGAAILAAVGSGFYPTVPAACEAMVRVGEKVPVDPDLARRYEALVPLFRRCYRALEGIFPELSTGG